MSGRNEDSVGVTLQLKFAEEHHEAILTGEKTATIRLPEVGDSWGQYQVGRTLVLCDEDGDRLHSAPITDRGYNDARSIAEHGIEGHRDYDDVDEFLEEMREYYPDANLTPETCFEIVYWGDVWA